MFATGPRSTLPRAVTSKLLLPANSVVDSRVYSDSCPAVMLPCVSTERVLFVTMLPPARSSPRPRST